ncbi:MAG: acyl-CoA thioesterase/BAAT N-terminal domain-containing protein [Pseudomonadota bacterium]
MDIFIENVEQNVRITTRRSFGRNRLTVFEASALYAPEDQLVDVSQHAPISGSYSGVAPAGLFWSMTDTSELAPENADPTQVSVLIDVGDDRTVEFTDTITIGQENERFTEQPVDANLVGAFLFLPDNIDTPPVIITLGGSEGGDRSARNVGAKFASRGFAVLGLPYYSPAGWGGTAQFPDLPDTFVNIPIDRLETARDYLRTRSDVNSDRMGLYGVSKGAEFVLAGSSLIEGFSSVAAVVPTDVIWEGFGDGVEENRFSSFTWRGDPLPFVPYVGIKEEYAKYGNPNETVRLRTPHDAGRAAYPERADAARIRVEDIDEPVFLVGGDEDTVWASGPMARSIKETRDRAGLQTELWVGETATHYLSGDGYAPIRGENNAGATEEAKLKVAAWRALIEFFNTTLK